MDMDERQKSIDSDRNRSKVRTLVKARSVDYYVSYFEVFFMLQTANFPLGCPYYYLFVRVPNAYYKAFQVQAPPKVGPLLALIARPRRSTLFTYHKAVNPGSSQRKVSRL